MKKVVACIISLILFVHVSIPNSKALETSVSEISYQEAIVNYYPETENEEIVFPTEDL